MRTWLGRVSVWIAIGGACLLGFGAAARAQATDPVLGTWVLDVARSTFSPGPAPASASIVVQPAGTAVRVSVVSTGADGKAVKWGFITERDGADVPVTGNPAYDTAATSRESAIVGTTRYKKAGKVVMTAQTAIAADGATLTVTSQGHDPLGRAVHNVAVYTRQ